MLEYIGVKIGTLIPAVFGALVYAMRVGVQSWSIRLVGLVTGVITAIFVGPGAAELLEAGEKGHAAIIFLTGVGGAGIVEVVIGFLKDPIGFYNQIRKGK